MKLFSLKRNKGFTLLESLVAISIFTVSILALLSVLSRGIASTTFAKNKITATYLAQEGVEYMRNMRDNLAIASYDTDPQTGWTNFTTAVTSATYPITDPAFSGFNRTLTPAPIVTANEVKISATVSWTQGTTNYSVTFSDTLFNWIE